MFISSGKFTPKVFPQKILGFTSSLFQTVANAIKADILGIAMFIIKL